jgi:cytochrome b6-f complex iron-sulfur subunit
MKRRELIRKALLGGTTLFVAPAFITSCSKDEDPLNNGGNNGGGTDTGGNKITIDLSSPVYSDLNSAGGSKVVQSVIIANTGSDVFVALSSVCTHEGCTVNYIHAASNFQCPCHQSMFAKTGSVINGPAATALKSYPVSKSGNILTISL